VRCRNRSISVFVTLNTARLRVCDGSGAENWPADSRKLVNLVVAIAAGSETLICADTWWVLLQARRQWNLCALPVIKYSRWTNLFQFYINRTVQVSEIRLCTQKQLLSWWTLWCHCIPTKTYSQRSYKNKSTHSHREITINFNFVTQNRSRNTPMQETIKKFRAKQKLLLWFRSQSPVQFPLSHAARTHQRVWPCDLAPRETLDTRAERKIHFGAVNFYVLWPSGCWLCCNKAQLFSVCHSSAMPCCRRESASEYKSPGRAHIWVCAKIQSLARPPTITWRKY
jgi:hypothetical protein